jgi:hypothetical protein
MISGDGFYHFGKSPCDLTPHKPRMATFPRDESCFSMQKYRR